MNLGHLPDYLAARTEPVRLLDEPLIEPVKVADLLPLVLPEDLRPQKADAPGALDASKELETVTEKSFRKLNEILDLPLSKDDEDFATMLRVQMTAVQTVLNTNVRVDENRMKRRSNDNLAAILAKLATHEAKMQDVVTIEG